MNVSLLFSTPDMLKVAWTAARTCYSKNCPLTLWNSFPEREEMLPLVRQIFRRKHLSVLEHCAATYAVSGVSRTLLAQYSRHIGISLSVQSQRHVTGLPATKRGFVVPPRLAKNEGALEEYYKAMEVIDQSYHHLLQAGISKEDARFLLPGGATTNLVTTVNLRSLQDLYGKRVVTPGAQWEIKELIIRMIHLLVEKEMWLNEFFPLHGGVQRGEGETDG